MSSPSAAPHNRTGPGPAAIGPIVSIDVSEVRPGKLAELRSAIAALVAFVDANEPRTIAYAVVVSSDEQRMTVLQVHPDASSMEEHMRVAGPAFAPFAELVELLAIDIYGRPSAALLDLIRQKARLLHGPEPSVHPMAGVVVRAPAPPASGSVP